MADRGLVLLADIGGTNARFALTDSITTSRTEILKVAEYDGVPQAIKRFLARNASKAKIGAAAVAGTSKTTAAGSQAALRSA